MEILYVIIPVHTWYIPVHTGMYRFLHYVPVLVHTGTYRYIPVCTKYPDFLQPVGIPDDPEISRHILRTTLHTSVSNSACSMNRCFVHIRFFLVPFRVLHVGLSSLRMELKRLGARARCNISSVSLSSTASLKIRSKFAFGKPLAPSRQLHEFVLLTREKTQLFDCEAQPNGSSGSFGGELLDVSVKVIRPGA